ncbi:MAG TPA: methyltransferase domain-containing protein [Aliidongia sp.]|uniref:class I SAM-dependent methyltransferase n=1 Tax=Aliidongia sp. TaxID=1914230 RepID=UPI002DDCC2F3|nr:methyltransferase domain-containing protein [Aliidongia sp.]HEV2676095.1 methyltransferase domain-containing protein [Aliidongia sp.]
MTDAYVPESRFGLWFLKSEIWVEHVLARAVADLDRLIPDRRPSYPVIVDVGCGWGRSFALLHDRFRPERMVGIDIDADLLEAAAAEASRCRLSVAFARTSSACLGLPDQSADMVFCHQTFHHLVDQEAALREFYRVLKPGGLLLFAESTRKYIHSWAIRLLFRHPMEVQRSAEEYIAMIAEAGFAVAPASISYPYLWWSRSDLGILERCFGRTPPVGREETLVNLVAVRP